jgi:hypothetical protein
MVHYVGSDAVAVQSTVRPACLRRPLLEGQRVDADGVVRRCPPTSVNVVEHESGSLWRPRTSVNVVEHESGSLWLGSAARSARRWSGRSGRSTCSVPTGTCGSLATRAPTRLQLVRSPRLRGAPRTTCRSPRRVCSSRRAITCSQLTSSSAGGRPSPTRARAPHSTLVRSRALAPHESGARPDPHRLARRSRGQPMARPQRGAEHARTARAPLIPSTLFAAPGHGNARRRPADVGEDVEPVAGVVMADPAARVAIGARLASSGQ